jgi:hypothetical protein
MRHDHPEEVMEMAESTSTTKPKATTAKASAEKEPETPDTVVRGDQGATLEGEKPRTATGADYALAETDGETRPTDDDFGANAETFESKSWAQTHGENPLEAPRGDY